MFLRRVFAVHRGRFSQRGAMPGPATRWLRRPAPSTARSGNPRERWIDRWITWQSLCPTCCLYITLETCKMTRAFFLIFFSAYSPYLGTRTTCSNVNKGQFHPSYAPKDHVKCWRKVANILCSILLFLKVSYTKLAGQALLTSTSCLTVISFQGDRSNLLFSMRMLLTFRAFVPSHLYFKAYNILQYYKSAMVKLRFIGLEATQNFPESNLVSTFTDLMVNQIFLHCYFSTEK